MITEEEDDRVLLQPFLFQVFQEETQPSIYILYRLKMSGIVGTHLRQVGHVGGQREQRRIDSLLGVISAPIGVEGTDASHVRSHGIEYGKEGLVFPAFRTVVRSLFVTLVPATLIVCGRIVVCLAVVGAIISGFA